MKLGNPPLEYMDLQTDEASSAADVMQSLKRNCFYLPYMSVALVESAVGIAESV